MLLVGAGGRLGAAVLRAVPEAIALTHRDLDVTDTAAVRRTVGSMAPSAVVNCTAFTDVDAAERAAALAHAVNCTAVGELAAAAHAAGSAFLTFSTDFVFDGASSRPYVESNAPHPINVYGETKLCGERLARERHPGCLVVRSSWLFSGSSDDFVTRVLAAASRHPIKVVDDRRGSPTLTDDLAAASIAALRAGVSGVLHIANAGDASRYELAVAAAGLAGIDPGRISACSSDEFPLPATRPAASILASEREEASAFTSLRGWREALVPAVERFVAATP